MCWAMYLFTENIIDEIKWDDKNPGMFIENITLKKKSGKELGDDVGVFNWNENKRNIYYIGSSQGCGCGWQSPQYGFIDMNDETEKNEFENRIKDRNNFYNLLKSNDFIRSYIIICWEGDQYKEINKVEKLNIEKIKDVDYNFNELTKYLLE
jgi:hypothetical protein